jgi:hypothetical protein
MKKSDQNKKKSSMKKNNNKSNKKLNVNIDLSKNITYEIPSRNIGLPFFTALFFITNIGTALYKQYYVYASLFAFLTITSLFAHSSDNIYINIIDKIGVFFIVTHGGYILYTKLCCNDKNNCIIIGAVISFAICILLYIYGNLKKSFCFHPNTCIAHRYHGLLHFISSLGHHFIIFA